MAISYKLPKKLNFDNIETRDNRSQLISFLSKLDSLSRYCQTTILLTDETNCGSFDHFFAELHRRRQRFWIPAQDIAEVYVNQFTRSKPILPIMRVQGMSLENHLQ